MLLHTPSPASTLLPTSSTRHMDSTLHQDNTPHQDNIPHQGSTHLLDNTHPRDSTPHQDSTPNQDSTHHLVSLPLGMEHPVECPKVAMVLLRDNMGMGQSQASSPHQASQGGLEGGCQPLW